MTASFALCSNIHKRQPGYAIATGQSLVEFVLVMPIFVLVLVGGMAMGMGAYQAHMAADAVKEPMLKKLEMSNTPNAVAGGMLNGYMNGSPLQGSLQMGSKIDNVQIVNVDDYTSVMVGNKQYQSIASFVPSFTIKVSQPINRNLLQAANSGAPSRPAGTPWVPFGTPVLPPWEGGIIPGCEAEGITGTIAIVSLLTPPPVPPVPITVTDPVTGETSTIMPPAEPVPTTGVAAVSPSSTCGALLTSAGITPGPPPVPVATDPAATTTATP